MTMTYETFMEPRAIHGVPGLAFRLGRALEVWARAAAARDAARPVRVPQTIRADARAAHDQRAMLRLF